MDRGRIDTREKTGKILRSMLFITFLTGTDQLAKQAAARFLRGGDQIRLVRNILALEYYENRGAAFNSLVNQRILLILVTVPVIVFLAERLFRLLEIERYAGVSFCICLIIGGATGNLIDRVSRGYVVDFIHVTLINFPIFNFADMFVCGGAVLLGVMLILYYTEADLNFLLDFQRR